MKVKILKDFRGLKSSKEITFTHNDVNVIMGLNGSGKSTLLGLLVSELQKKDPKLKKDHHWMALVKEPGVISLEDVPDYDKILYNTDKIRHSQWVDLSVAIKLGVETLNLSEGENSRINVMRSLNHDSSKTLHIFDETDKSFDIRSKRKFYSVLRKLKGTVILVTHDPYFVKDLMVFDLDHYDMKTGEQYCLQY